jgi:sigma-B regulation protein RsbU (phosphoserine phosphatase)
MTRTGHTDVIHRAFKGLDEPAVDMLRHFAVKKTYPANHVLCDEGQVAETLFVVMSGRVVISRNIEGDEDFVLGVLGPGGFFGEMALLTGEARAATVTTIMETDVLEITKEQFEQVFSASPAMARTILQTLAHTITETDKRAIEDLEARNAELASAYAELEAAQADRIAKAALEAQLEVAAKAQRSLLPMQLPSVPGFQFAAQFEPARHIGGDFYDAKQLDDGSVSVLVADISDKGAHAALFMAVARALFLTEQKHSSAPADVAMAVHRGLLEASNYDMFVTAFYGVLDPDSRVLRYVRAGHDEPILVRRNGDTELLTGRGRFLGLWPEFEPVFEERQIVFEPGDCLVIYSDGVTDMRSPSGEPFGRERLKQVVRGVRLYDAERIARSIYSGVQRHRDYAEAFDDFTLVVVRAE